MANVGFVSERFKDKKYIDSKDRNKMNMKHRRLLVCLEYWTTGKALVKRRNTLLFNKVCKNLEVLDGLRGVNTQALFAFVHYSSF